MRVHLVAFVAALALLAECSMAYMPYVTLVDTPTYDKVLTRFFSVTDENRVAVVRVAPEHPWGPEHDGFMSMARYLAHFAKNSIVLDIRNFMAADSINEAMIERFGFEKEELPEVFMLQQGTGGTHGKRIRYEKYDGEESDGAAVRYLDRYLRWFVVNSGTWVRLNGTLPQSVAIGQRFAKLVQKYADDVKGCELGVLDSSENHVLRELAELEADANAEVEKYVKVVERVKKGIARIPTVPESELLSWDYNPLALDPQRRLEAARYCAGVVKKLRRAAAEGALGAAGSGPCDGPAHKAAKAAKVSLQAEQQRLSTVRQGKLRTDAKQAVEHRLNLLVTFEKVFSESSLKRS